MRYVASVLFVAMLAWLHLPLSSPAQSQPSVWTYHYDNARTGANTNETNLTPANVNTNTFGKLFSVATDGYAYAQPLYIPNVAITNKGTHNVVFIATENDTVYALDADSNSGSNSTPLWSSTMLGSGESVLNTNDVSVAGNVTTDITPKIGITGTPVIDTNTATLYVVAKSKTVVGSTTNIYYRLHALDITSGTERPNSPVLIQATVSGTGEDSSGGLLSFNPRREHNRSGLLLISNTVFIVFASHGDISPYHGWVLGYNKSTLAQVSVFNTAPNGVKTGIWQGGNGPAADTNGNFFFMTGNGTYDGPTNNDYGDSFVRLTTTNIVTNLFLADYFTPYNQLALGGGGNDSDIGSGGPLLLPDSVGSASHRHLLVGAGKGQNAQGGVTIYLIDRDNMGHYNVGGSSDPNIVQEVVGQLPVPQMSTPTYWNFRLYYVAFQDFVHAFSISNAVLSTTAVDTSSIKASSWFGTTMAISANGNSNGILWVIDPYKGTTSNSVLHAYNASQLSTELYNSAMAGSRDTAGGGVKFTVPTVANGKVYIGGQSSVVVYGVITSNTAPTVTLQPQSQTVAVGSRVTLTVGGQSSNGFTTRWYFDGMNVVSGAAATNFTIVNAQLTNAGYYYATLSNSVGVTTSSLAYLSVVAPLTNSSDSALAPSGLVNWWPADGNAFDIFGPNNATPQNNLTYGTGESGLAFQFDGVGAYLNVGASNLPTPWTACMWVNRQNGITNATILMGDNNNYSLKLEQYNNTRKVGFTQLGVADYIFPSGYIVPAGVWTHLTFVGTATNVSLYVNGVFNSSTNVANFPLPRSYIGAAFSTPRFIDYLVGGLDEILVFNRALSASEISGIYSAGSAGLVRAPQFTSAIQQTNGQITLSMEGQTGKTFTLLTSSDLVNWTTLTTISNAVGTNSYTESIATNGTAKFYRLSQP